MRKILSIFLILTMILSLSACTPKQDGESDEPDTPPVNDQDIDDNNEADDEDDKDIENDSNSESSEEAEKEKEVELYFANTEYINTGDESLEKLKTEKRIIKYDGMSLEEAIVRELLKGPVDKENLSSPINDTVNLLEVKVTDGTAYVDFASEGLTGGSIQEVFIINQIIKSLINLDTVNRIQFLVDGKKAESLMGHVSIDRPFEDIAE